MFRFINDFWMMWTNSFSKKQKTPNISNIFDFFRMFQKVFPRIPGGCRHQESAGNQVLD